MLLLARIVFVVADEAASSTDYLDLAVEARMRRAIAGQVRASLAALYSYFFCPVRLNSYFVMLDEAMAEN